MKPPTSGFTRKTAYTLFRYEIPVAVKLGYFLSDYKATVVTTLGTVVTSLAEFFNWHRLFFLAGLLALAGGILLSSRETKRSSLISAELQESNESARRSNDAINQSLEQISTNLSQELGLWKSSVRITVYAHQRAERCFIPLVRKSNNPNIEGLNRKRYPDVEGHIGEAWENGRVQASKLTPRKARDEALKRGMSEDTYDALPFKFASCIGVRLSHSGNPIGVVFWESPDQDGIGVGDFHFDQIESNATLKDLASVVAASKEFLPRISGHELLNQEN